MDFCTFVRNMDHFADIFCIIITLVMRDFSDAIAKKNQYVRSCKRKVFVTNTVTDCHGIFSYKKLAMVSNVKKLISD